MQWFLSSVYFYLHKSIMMVAQAWGGGERVVA
jgi:hypothetical protein